MCQLKIRLVLLKYKLQHASNAGTSVVALHLCWFYSNHRHTHDVNTADSYTEDTTHTPDAETDTR